MFKTSGEKILRVLGKYNALWLKEYEKSSIDNYGKHAPSHQPLFIIGAPRTGSTILYQLITNLFDLLYIDNLVDIFHRNFYFGFWLSIRVFRDSPHNCYTSQLGNTKECGLHAPSECGGFWYRWLPKNKHHIDKGELEDSKVKEIRKNIYSVINRWNKPLVIKNLNSGQRLGLLADVCPDAHILFIKRDPLFTAQSILFAKKKLGLNPYDWWSVKPPNFEHLERLPFHEQIIKQIYYCEKTIVTNLEKYNFKNRLIIRYEDLFEDYAGMKNLIKHFINKNLAERTNADEIILNKKSALKLSNEDISAFRNEIDKLDWSVNENLL
jgi:hypothetical protein